MTTATPRPRSPRTPGRPAASPRGDAREQLLDTALTLFGQQGIAATTIAQIAAAAGVTPAMVHYYFKNRGHLLDAVVDERVSRFIHFVWEPLGEAGENDDGNDDPAALVAGVVQRIVTGIATVPWLPSLWIREILNEGGALRERVFRRLPLERVRRLADCVAAGQRRGTVHPDIEPRLMPVSIIGLTLMPLAVARIWQQVPGMPAITPEALARHVTGLLMHGLIRPAK